MLSRPQGPADRIVEWAKRRATHIRCTGQKNDGNIFPMFDNQEGKRWLLSMSTVGHVCIPFGDMRRSPPFSSTDLRQELVQRLNRIPGVEMSRIEGYPTVKLELFLPETSIQTFLETMEWAAAKILESEH